MNYDSILSERVKELRPSGIRRFFDILEEMKDAISLGVGEPDFVTPWHIRDAGIYSLAKAIHASTPPTRGWPVCGGNQRVPLRSAVFT